MPLQSTTIKVDFLVSGKADLDKLVSDSKRALDELKKISDEQIASVTKVVSKQLPTFSAPLKTKEDFEKTLQLISQQALIVKDLEEKISGITSGIIKTGNIQKEYKQAYNDLANLVKMYNSSANAIGRIEKASERAGKAFRTRIERLKREVLAMSKDVYKYSDDERLHKRYERIQKSVLSHTLKYWEAHPERLERIVQRINRIRKKIDPAIMQERIRTARESKEEREAVDGKLALLNKLNSMRRRYITDTRKLIEIESMYSKVESLSAMELNKKGDTYKKLSEQLANMNTRFIEQKNHLGPLSHAWEKFRLILGRVAHALISFVIINNIQRAFAGFFKSLFSSNQQLEVLNARIKVLIPSAHKINEIWGNLIKMTVTTPYTLQEYVDASATIRAFGIDINENMKAIADWSSAVGEDLKETAVAFAKIAIYSPRTALLLSTRGIAPSLFKSYLNEYKNATIALKRLIEDLYGDTSTRIAATFQGVMSNINDMWLLISKTFGQPLFQEVKSYLNLIYDTLSKLTSQTKDVDTLGRIFKGVFNVTIITAFSAILSYLIIKFKDLFKFLLTRGNILLRGGFFAFILSLPTLLIPLITTYERMRRISKSISEIAEIPHTKADTTKKLIATQTAIENINEQLSNMSYNKITEFFAYLGGRQTGRAIVTLATTDNLFTRFVSFIFPSYEQGLKKMKRSLMDTEQQLQKINQELIRQRILKAAVLSPIELYELFGKGKNIKDFPMLREAIRRTIGDLELEIRKLEEKLKEQNLTDEAIQNIKNTIATHKALITLFNSVNQSATFSVDNFVEHLKALSNQIATNDQEFANLRGATIQTLSELLSLEGSFRDSSISAEDLANKIAELREKLVGIKAGALEIVSGENIANLYKISSLIERVKSISEEIGIQANVMDILENMSIDKITNFIKQLEISKQREQEILAMSKEEGKKAVEKLEREIKLFELLLSELLKNIYDYNNKIKNLIDDLAIKLNDLSKSARDTVNTIENLLFSLDKKVSELTIGYVSTNILTDQIKQLRQRRSEIEKLIRDSEEKYGKATKEEIENRIKLYIKDEKALDNYIKALQNRDELEREYINLLSAESDILVELGERAENFTEGMRKAISKLNSEVSRMWEKLGDDIISAFKETISDIINYTLSPSDFTKNIDERIKDLRERLNEVRLEKTGVRVVENEEAKILREINKLEQERANILRTQVLKFVDKIKQSLIDMASQYIAKEVFSLFITGEDQKINNIKTLNEEIARIKTSAYEKAIQLADVELIKMREMLSLQQQISNVKTGELFNIGVGSSGGNGGVPTTPTTPPVAPKAEYKVNVNINAPIYGVEDLDKAIQNSIYKANRRLR